MENHLAKMVSEDQTGLKGPKHDKVNKGYVDLRPRSNNYRRYDELENNNAAQINEYYEILPDPVNHTQLPSENSNRLKGSPEKQVRCTKQQTTIIITIVITCIISVGLTFLIFHYTNTDTSYVGSCETLICDTGQCYTNADGQPICITGSDSFYISEIQSDCPSDWLSFKNSCYRQYDLRRTWYQSRSFCRSMGADLVSILDNEEANLDIFPDQTSFYWIGLNNIQQGNKFTWSDGSSLNYSNWNRGEPNNENDNEHCVHLRRDNFPRKWNDINCFMSLKFVCKKEQKPQCGTGSWYYHDNACYLFNTNTTETWEDARQACINVNADLVSINTINENNFIVSRVTKTPFQNLWIGLSKDTTNGELMWVDGSKPEVLYFGMLVRDAINTNCVRIFSEYGTWEYRNCRNFNGYICEKNI